MVHRSSQCPELVPAYMISMGNQTDLTLGDMVRYFKDSSEVDVIAVYAEGFVELDGLAFCRAVRDAVLEGKEVVFYKAGRTPEGKSATSGHTASLAGDYMVCENCVRQAGAIVAQDFNQFQDLFLLAETAIPAFDLSAPESIARLLPEVARESDKPIIGVIDGGRLYDGLRDRLMAEGVPVFPVSDRAVAALAQYIQARLYADVLRGGLGG